MAAATSSHVALMGDQRIIHFGDADEMLTDKLLSETYGIPLSVAEFDGEKVILWKKL
jgi:ABC-type enterochelin transport system ATPase subunit